MIERSEKQRYLHDELFSLTLMGTVQRAHVYAPGAAPDLRASFQRELRAELEAAGRRSLPEWELQQYNRTSMASKTLPQNASRTNRKAN